MATLLPPPKRIKLTHGTAELPKAIDDSAEPAPAVVVQFVSEDDGKPLGAAVSLPSDLSRDALESLVNTLDSSVSRMCL